MRFIFKEVGKYCSTSRYDSDERNLYFNWLDENYNASKDCFGDYVSALMAEFPDLSIYQAVGYVFVWLYTREKDFNLDKEQEEK